MRSISKDDAVLHPYFNQTGNIENDIAIIELKHKIEMDHYAIIGSSNDIQHPFFIGVVKDDDDDTFTESSCLSGRHLRTKSFYKNIRQANIIHPFHSKDKCANLEDIICCSLHNGAINSISESDSGNSLHLDYPLFSNFSNNPINKC